MTDLGRDLGGGAIGCASHLSVDRLSLVPASLQLLDSLRDPSPDRRALHVALVHQLIGPLSRLRCSLVPMLIEKQRGHPPDVWIVHSRIYG
jgi:hypothetical protein